MGKYGRKSSAEAANACGMDLICEYGTELIFGSVLVTSLKRTTSLEDLEGR